MLGTVITLALESVASKVVEMTIFPPLLQSPYIYYVFALLVVTAIAIWWPEIWGWISPTERIIRRSEKQLNEQRRTKVKRVLSDMRNNPWLESIQVIDFEKGIVEAVVNPPRTWQQRVARFVRRARPKHPRSIDGADTGC